MNAIKQLGSIVSCLYSSPIEEWPRLFVGLTKSLPPSAQQALVLIGFVTASFEAQRLIAGSTVVQTFRKEIHQTHQGLREAVGMGGNAGTLLISHVLESTHRAAAEVLGVFAYLESMFIGIGDKIGEHTSSCPTVGTAFHFVSVNAILFATTKLTAYCSRTLSKALSIKIDSGHIAATAGMFAIASHELHKYLTNQIRGHNYCEDSNFEYYEMRVEDPIFERRIMKSISDERRKIKNVGWFGRTYEMVQTQFHEEHKDVAATRRLIAVKGADNTIAGDSTTISGASDISGNDAYKESSMDWLLPWQAKDLIDLLYYDIDNSNDGNASLDYRDFSQLNLALLWERIQKHQDEDDDKKVSLNEFRRYFMKQTLRTYLSDTCVLGRLDRLFRKSCEALSPIELLTMAHHFVNKNFVELCEDFQKSFQETDLKNIDVEKRVRVQERFSNHFDKLKRDVSYDGNDSSDNRLLWETSKIREAVADHLCCDDSMALSWMLPPGIVKAIDNTFKHIAEEKIDAELKFNSIVCSDRFSFSQKGFRAFIISTAVDTPNMHLVLESPCALSMLSSAKASLQRNVANALAGLLNKRGASPAALLSDEAMAKIRAEVDRL